MYRIDKVSDAETIADVASSTVILRREKAAAERYFVRVAILCRMLRPCIRRCQLLATREQVRGPQAHAGLPGVLDRHAAPVNKEATNRCWSMTADRELSPAEILSTGTCLQFNGRHIKRVGDDEKTDCDVNAAGT